MLHDTEDLPAPRPKRQCTLNRTYREEATRQDHSEDSEREDDDTLSASSEDGHDDAQDSDFEEDNGSESDSDSESLSDDEDDDDQVSEELVDSDSEDVDLAAHIRTDLMRDNTSYYQTFRQLKRKDVVDALRFMRNVDIHVDSLPVSDILESIFKWDTTEEFTKSVHGLRDKLLERYDVSNLPDAGGIPLAYRRSNMVCTLFATLLARVVPTTMRTVRDMALAPLPADVKDPLSEHLSLFDSSQEMVAKIWEHIDMAALEGDAYIRRCIGGAVACLCKYQDDIKPDFLECFKPRGRGVSNTNTSKSIYRILGASKIAERKPNENRLIIPLYPREPHDKPTYICAHVDERLEMRDLLSTCKEKYPDVAEVLQEKQYKLVFSQQPSKFHFSGDDLNYQMLDVVRVPPRYKLSPARWDRRGIFSAVEASESGKIDAFDVYKLSHPKFPKSIHFHVVNCKMFNRMYDGIRSLDLRDASIEDVLGLNLDDLLRRNDGLRITMGMTRKSRLLYRGSKLPSEDTIRDRAVKLREIIKQFMEQLSQYVGRFFERQRQAKLQFPGSITAQRFVHDFLGASITFYPRDVDPWEESDASDAIIDDIRVEGMLRRATIQQA